MKILRIPCLMSLMMSNGLCQNNYHRIGWHHPHNHQPWADHQPIGLFEVAKFVQSIAINVLSWPRIHQIPSKKSPLSTWGQWAIKTIQISTTSTSENLSFTSCGASQTTISIPSITLLLQDALVRLQRNATQLRQVRQQRPVTPTTPKELWKMAFLHSFSELGGASHES